MDGCHAVQWMLVRSLSSDLDNQVNGRLTIDGRTAREISCLVSTSHWHVKLEGLEFNGAAVKTMPYAIVDSGPGS